VGKWLAVVSTPSFSVASSNHWGGIKRGISPTSLLHDSARFSLEGSNRAGAGNGEVFENKRQIADDDGRLIMDHDGTGDLYRGYLGDGRPQRRANREVVFISTPPRESSRRSK
jgi:hypothetical protein